MGGRGKNSGASAKKTVKSDRVNSNIESAREWNSENFDIVPEKKTPQDARKLLEAGFYEQSPDGRTVKFGREVIDHWVNEEKYDAKQVNGRLSKIEMARVAVRTPAEIWDQGNQTAFVQAFRKTTGGKQGVVVFVDKNNIARTYFPKDVNALDNVRKGKRIFVKVLE